MTKKMTPLATREDDMSGANANALLDALIQERALKNDAALSRLLQIAPPVISKLRHGRNAITASIILRMHDVTGIPVARLRELARQTL